MSNGTTHSFEPWPARRGARVEKHAKPLQSALHRAGSAAAAPSRPVGYAVQQLREASRNHHSATRWTAPRPLARPCPSGSCTDVRHLPRGDAARGSPCCDNATTTESTTRFCLECLRMNCEHGGGVAAAARVCRAWISVEDEEVVAHDGTGRCSICMQEPRVLVARGRAPGGGRRDRDARWLGQPDRAAVRVPGLRRRPAHPAPTCGATNRGARGRSETRRGPVTCVRHLHAMASDKRGRRARVPHGDAPESWGVDIVRQIREQAAAASAAAAVGDRPRAPSSRPSSSTMEAWRPRRRRGGV